MKQKFKPIFAVILVASMVCLSACGGKPASGTSQNSSGGGEIVAENTTNQNNDATAESDSSEITESTEQMFNEWYYYDYDDSSEPVITKYPRSVMDGVSYDYLSYVNGDGIFDLPGYLQDLGYEVSDGGYDFSYNGGEYSLAMSTNYFLISLQRDENSPIVGIRSQPYTHTGLLHPTSPQKVAENLYGTETLTVCTAVNKMSGTMTTTTFPTKHLLILCELLDKLRTSPSALTECTPFGCSIEIGVRGESSLRNSANVEVYVDEETDEIVVEHPQWIPYR